MGLKKRGAKKYQYATIGEKRAAERAYYRTHKKERKVSSQKTYQKLKAKWMEIFKEHGLMECSKCGYNKCFAAIEFHHTDPKTKRHRTDGRTQLVYQLPVEGNIEELNNIVALCANCHREVHDNG